MSSYDNPNVGFGDVKNEVKFEYNNLLQLVREYQQTDDEVDPSSPNVQYGYETSTRVNNARRKQMTYPNGRILDWGYAGTLNDKLSRVYSITSGGTSLVQYEYMGLSRFTRVTYPQPNATFGFAGSLDYFDRLKQMFWTVGSTTIEHLKWGYDTASNRTYRRNEVARTAARNSTSCTPTTAYSG